MVSAGWTKGGRPVEGVAGADRYFLGEETGLLYAMADRPPFPRTAPPYRHGADEVGHDITDPAGTSLADSQGFTGASATLVNNVETVANLPYIVLHGPEQFRSLGTPESPGTMICTVTGCTERAGVGEFELGTPLSEVNSTLGRPPRATPIISVPSGTANAFLHPDPLDVPPRW